MSRDKVEVGKLINREMNKWQNRVDGNLYFPCLITDLCMEAGCEIETDELREKPSGAFDTKFKPRKRPGNASTSVDSQTLQRLVEQQNSLVKFVSEQFEWQKKVAAYVTKGKMSIPEPILPDWMKEIVEEEADEEDEVPLSTLHLKKVKQEKAKRARSPAKKKQSPAKKKQKKSSSEEEFRSSDLDLISDPSDENETAKLAEEVNSEEEEEESETEGEGSSSEKSNTQSESPPIKETPQSTIHETIIPQPSPTKPSSPEKDQPQPINEPEPEPEPTKEPNQPPAQEEPPVDPQPQPIQEPQEPNVVASEAPPQGAEVVKKPKLRVKHAPTESPFKRKKRGGSEVSEGGPTESTETGGEVQQLQQAEAQRQKLEVKKKQKADTSMPATATSGAFIATRSASVAVSTGTIAGSSDAVASIVPEVEKAPSDPVATKEDSAAELLRKKAWEDAKQRMAEYMAKDVQSEQPAPTVSEEPAATKGDKAEKNKEKKKKKKGEQSSQPVPRQSGRLRSGVLKK